MGDRGLRSVVLLCVIGLASGLLKGLLGIGGGVVVVPALFLLAGLKQKQAQAASLWYVVPTSFAAGFFYLRTEHIQIDLLYVAAMVAAALVGAWLGVRLVKRIRQQQLTVLFALALCAIAVIWAALPNHLLSTEGRPLMRYLVLTGTGLIAGLVSGLLGIGSGVLVIPLLVSLGGFKQEVAQGMSLLYTAPIALLCAVLYRVHVKIMIDAVQVTVMIVAGMLGAFAGCALLSHTPAGALHLLFTLALALVGLLLLIRARNKPDRTDAPDWAI